MHIYDRLSYDERLAHYLPAIEEQCKIYNVPLPWMLAIARQESNIKSSPITMTGGDGKRGGSYGMFQMSFYTARSLGYAGTPSDLLDIKSNAKLACMLVGSHRKRFGQNNLKDSAAAYNSGKPFSRAPQSTREHYVPNVLRFAAEFGWSDPS